MPDTTKPALNTTRRQFAAMGVAAAAAAGFGSSVASAAPLTIAEASVSIPAAQGTSAGTLFHPAAGDHPGLVMFASAATSPAVNAVVARQLAGEGWAVLLVDAVSGTDPRQVNRNARAHVSWLTAQPGVDRTADAFSLRSFSAAQPAVSLASRTERRAAAASGVLFAVSPDQLGQTGLRRESLHSAARSLHRLAA